MDRRKFLKKTLKSGSATLASTVVPFYIMPSKPRLEETVLGHGNFKYRLEKEWGNLDSQKYPVNNCHEMVMDRREHLFL